jgi:signal transduction histidine kinase
MWVALDAVGLTAVVGLSTVPAIVPGPPGQSPFYNFSVVAVIALGLPRWPVAATLIASTVLALANIASAVRPESSYPLWNAVPDSATYVGAALLAWILARLVRASAASLDRLQDAAVARAAALAGERERARQQRDLGTHLLSTVDELADSDAIVDPVIREQVRREAQWLRQVVEHGLPQPDATLLAALRDLVVEKTSAGMRIDLDLPEAEPALGPATVGAVVEAAREALTNVAKHAGQTRAAVVVRPRGNGIAIEINDTGRGYDAARATSGVGQRRSIRERIEEVGGRVEIDSSRDTGTRVWLWVPQSRKDPL